MRVEVLGLSLRDIERRRESLLLNNVGARLRVPEFSLLEDILVDDVDGFTDVFRGAGGTERVLREVGAC